MGSGRLALIDDDVKLAGLLTEYFKQYGYELSAYAHPDEGIREVLRRPPDLLILDLMLPGKDGFQVCREIRAQSSVPILMLTARGDTNDRIVGLELGADDYLPKPFEPRELVARIQAILRRGKPRAILHHLRSDSLRVDLDRREAALDGRPIDLTTAEFDLLALFMKNPGKTLDRDAILGRLHGVEWDAFSRTVDVTMSRLRQKLGEDSKHGRFFKTVRGAGYLWVAEVVEE